jgi:hypothetical protein
MFAWICVLGSMVGWMGEIISLLAHDGWRPKEGKQGSFLSLKNIKIGTKFEPWKTFGRPLEGNNTVALSSNICDSQVPRHKS